MQMTVTTEAILKRIQQGYGKGARHGRSGQAGEEDIQVILQGGVDGDPVRRDGVQLHLGGKAGGEQPEDREENKEQHRHGEQGDEEFAKEFPRSASLVLLRPVKDPDINNRHDDGDE